MMANGNNNKRQAILDAALGLFNDLGLQGASTAKIAKKARVATGTLFHYFPTKEELIRQLFLQIKTHMKAAMTQGLDEQASVRAKLRQIWFNGVNWGHENPLMANFMSQIKIYPHVANISLGEEVERLQEMRDVVAQGVEQDILKDMPEDLRRELWGGALLSAINYFRANPGQFKNQRVLELSFQIFWDSMRL